jgi:rubredoxin
VRCPAGHETTATDYCDTCGLALDDAAAAPPASAPSTGATDATSAPAAGSCPHCSLPTPPNALFCENCGYDFTTGSLPRPPEPAATPVPSVADQPDSAHADLNPSPAPAEAWVAEVWIDPDWYADQQSTDPLPSPGLPAVVALRHSSVLIGRASRSRNIEPGIDLDSDSGVSRRHAQLTTDGSRWFVEDLGSSNGTYVGGGLGTLPTTPIPVGQRTQVTGDDRIYLGAWTRIVVRRAAPGEG